MPPFRPAPMLGEHNEYVFKQLLGLDDAAFEELVQTQIIGDT